MNKVLSDIATVLDTYSSDDVVTASYYNRDYPALALLFSKEAGYDLEFVPTVESKDWWNTPK